MRDKKIDDIATIIDARLNDVAESGLIATKIYEWLLEKECVELGQLRENVRELEQQRKFPNTLRQYSDKVSELEKTVETYKEEVSSWIAQRKYYYEKWEQSQSRVATLEAALDTYGRHLNICPIYPSKNLLTFLCICGFNEALAGTSTGGGDLEKVIHCENCVETNPKLRLLVTEKDDLLKEAVEVMQTVKDSLLHRYISEEWKDKFDSLLAKILEAGKA